MNFKCGADDLFNARIEFLAKTLMKKFQSHISTGLISLFAIYILEPDKDYVEHGSQYITFCVKMPKYDPAEYWCDCWWGKKIDIEYVEMPAESFW